LMARTGREFEMHLVFNFAMIWQRLRLELATSMKRLLA
jgi:hypothetical protein